VDGLSGLALINARWSRSAGSGPLLIYAGARWEHVPMYRDRIDPTCVPDASHLNNACIVLP